MCPPPPTDTHPGPCSSKASPASLSAGARTMEEGSLPYLDVLIRCSKMLSTNFAAGYLVQSGTPPPLHTDAVKLDSGGDESWSCLGSKYHHHPPTRSRVRDSVTL